jgi:hypothetical protein
MKFNYLKAIDIKKIITKSQCDSVWVSDIGGNVVEFSSASALMETSDSSEEDCACCCKQ